MNKIKIANIRVTLPMPIFLVIEDVGWWQGVDGSSYQEPYRNNLRRPHCLQDYRALTHLAERLSMRIALGMVMCEWDRTDFLKNVPGATWMGKSWNNKKNRGRHLELASHYLNNYSHRLEIALHGVGHEFWYEGRMERSEFHDNAGNMRPENIIIRHFEAFERLLDQNHIQTSPRLFIPPALNHSFGDGSMQALLKRFGIDYVTTKFSRARQFKAPKHPKITWESGVILLDRGSAPVEWSKVASPPAWIGPQPILPLHWGNLLHSQPERNLEIVDRWADMLLLNTSGPDLMLVEDIATCWRQAAVHYLAKIKNKNKRVIIDLSGLQELPSACGVFFIKIKGRPDLCWQSLGGKILEQKKESENMLTLKLLPDGRGKKVVIFPVDPIGGIEVPCLI